MRNYVATVVGSGPNGLCAAIRLAQAGFDVQVLESHSTPGGGMRSGAMDEEGFIHDHCSAIHPMALSSPFMRQLPLEEHGLEWIHPPAACAHPLDDEPAVLLHRSIEETADGLGTDAKRYRKWVQPFVSQWDQLCGDTLAPLGWPSHPWLLTRFGLNAFRTGRGLALKRFRGPRGRALFAGMAAHSVLPLEQRPSAAIGLMLQLAGHAVGWPFPRGGSGEITKALVSLLEHLGGRIQVNERVNDIRSLPDGPILFDTSPKAMAKICATELPKSYQKRLLRYRYGPGLFKVDWTLNHAIPWKDPSVARAATVHIGGHLDAICDSESAVWKGKFHDDPFVLLTQCSLFDVERAPPGMHTAWAYCHVPNGSNLNARAAIERQIERFAPGFQDCIRTRNETSAPQLESYNANYVGGDVNGGAPTLGQLFTRPVARMVPYRTPNPRIWICSASTPPGGGVHGMCGFFAAEDVVRRHRRLLRA